MKPLALALCLTLAACGSAGESPGSAATSPATAAAPTPAPVAAAPSPAAPSPTPLSTTAPVDPTPADPSTPAPGTVAGPVVYAAMLQRWEPTPAPHPSMARLTEAPGTQAYYFQQDGLEPLNTHTAPGLFVMSQGWQNQNEPGSSPTDLAGVSFAVPVVTAPGRLELYFEGRVTVWSPHNANNNLPIVLEERLMYHQSGLRFSDTPGVLYPLDQLLGRWADSPDRRIDLRLERDPSPRAFQLCWEAILQTARRSMCGRFDRETGAHLGVRIVDDSYGLGPKVWE